ncbi:MAG: CtsR family transcriptional regulator [Oscillospiraceae bacterium]|nr:CtsR family transcriptional regulator [Oscillospiraceae bacterium]
MSDIIAGFIDEMLSDSEGTAELQRAELANRFKCVPSQINYVISTRFSPEHGYIVESRRGGGGYIRIRRINMDAQILIMHTVNAIGDSIDSGTAAALLTNLKNAKAVSNNEIGLIISAISNNALRPVVPEERDSVRASILKQMLIHTNNT